MKLSWQLLPTCFLLVSACAFAEERDFGRLAKVIEAHYHVQREHIPLWGAIKPMFKSTHPLGAKSLEMAVFEDLTSDRVGIPQELGGLIQKVLEPKWQPLVRVFSKKSREQSSIYSRINGRDFRLIILTLDSGGAVLLEVELEPARLARWLQDPQHIGQSVKQEDDWQE